MGRELILEIGCEELPASWLPSLTRQLGGHLAARLAEFRLDSTGPVETFSTPRRLTARVADLASSQRALEETITGPPVSAAFGADGKPTPAALGFARKYGTEVSALLRVETPRGTYLAYAKHQRGKTTVDVLPDVLAHTLRDLSFAKQMRWDAALEDGRGELLFGRPIRWLLFLYGGRVVPFVIGRSSLAQGPAVEDVHSGALTYGHRFLATTGRPGRSIKVRSFGEYRARLAEHFVVLERTERRDRIVRELDANARKLHGRLAPEAGRSSLLDEVPDLVEYPSVVAGHFAPEFLDLPREVLTTSMIHHQHFFPLVPADGSASLMPHFLAVVNTEPDEPQTIAQNTARVLAARLRDARFFWHADREASLETRLERLNSIVFHQKLGSYRAKAERLERLADWIAREALGKPDAAPAAATAARLAKTDLTTEMVREFTELQGIMGGIYAREERLPEEVWKAIYHHYLPVSVEVSAPPGRLELGAAAVTWAAVALADKLDTIVGMFHVGEIPSGSRDPFGLRRQGHGVFKVLVDLPELTGLSARPTVGGLVKAAAEPFEPLKGWDETKRSHLHSFLIERLRYVLEQRGFDIRNVRAVTHQTELDDVDPAQARLKLEVLPEFTGSPEFTQLAIVFKRVKNIARELPDREFESVVAADRDLRARLSEPAEAALLADMEQREPKIERSIAREEYRDAFAEAAAFGPALDRFFKEVFVMVDDPDLRKARLMLMKRLEKLMLKLADVSEMVPE